MRARHAAHEPHVALRAVLAAAFFAIALLVAFAPRAQAAPADHLDQYMLTRLYESRLPEYDTSVPYPDGLLTPDAERSTIDTSSLSSVLESAFTLLADEQPPSSYDSRDAGIISSVKNQGSEGCCWAFGICESAQADYLNSHSLPALDLSEWQLAYFMYDRPVDALSNTVDDVVSTPYEIGSTQYYSTGGNAWIGTFGIANGIGFAHEDDANYAVMEKLLGTNGKATLDDSACYPADSYSLEGTCLVDPSTQRQLMKRMIMEHGAGTMAFNSASSRYDFDHNSFYNPTGYSSSGHLVAVVGWNDGFPKENFLTPAPADGAWLCKNSWGESWGDNGYFWMSYEEPSLSHNSSVFFEIADNDSFDHAYFYDGTVSVTMIDGYELGANVYTAKQDETVKAIGFYTTENDTDYELSVYLNPASGDPTSGEPVLSGVSGSVEVPGYQLVRLTRAQRFDVDAGDTFAVVVRETKDGDATSTYLDQSSDNSWVLSKSASAPGQSYVSSSGDAWEDISAKRGNLRIKAFTSVRAGDEPSELEFEQSSYQINLGRPGQLTVLADGETASTTQHTLFSSSDTSVARVDGLGTVYPRSEGETTITATLGALEATTLVTVKSPDVQAIRKPADYATEDNPLEVTVSRTTTSVLEYTMVGGQGLQPTWSYEYLGDVPDHLFGVDDEKRLMEFQDDGRFKAVLEGMYHVTASYTNPSGSTVSQDFYVHASLDVVHCQTAADLSYVGYDNQKTCIFMYEGARNADGYKITLSDESATEYACDMLHVVTWDSTASSADIGAQEVLDYTSGHYQNPVMRRNSYSGSRLSGLEITVPRRDFALVFTSDTFVTDHGFEVTSLEPRVAATKVIVDSQYWDDDSEDEVVRLRPGESVKVPYTVVPANSTDRVMYRSTYDDGVITIDEDGTIHAVGIGETEVQISAFYDFSPYWTNLGGYRVVVSTDETPQVSFEQGETVSLVRGESTQLSLVENAWSRAAMFSSSDPVVATVDSSGMVTAYSVGTTRITASYSSAAGSASDEVVVSVGPGELATSNMRVGPFVAGMDERYEYRFPGAEVVLVQMGGYFLNSDTPVDADELTVLDSRGAVVWGPRTGYSFDRSTFVVNGDACVFVFDSTASSKAPGTRVSGSFTINGIVAGKRPTSLGAPTSVELTIPASGVVTQDAVAEVPLTAEPAGAAILVNSTVADTSICSAAFDAATGKLMLSPWNVGKTTVTLKDLFGHTATVNVTVKKADPVPDVTVSSLEVLDNEGLLEGDVLELEEGDWVSLPLSVEPAENDEHVSATSGNIAVCAAYTTGSSSGEPAVQIAARRAGVAKVRVKTESALWKTITVNVRHKHSYTDEVTPPTCTEQGYTTHWCECGDSYVDAYVDPAHRWGAWTTVKPATTTAAGSEQRACSACGEVETRAIPKIPTKTTTTQKVKWERIWGATAPITMQKIAAKFGKAKVAVVTTDASYKDALAASALAGKNGAIVLMTKKGSLTAQTKAALKSAGVKTVYLVGSTKDVTAKVDKALKSGTGVTKVTRVSGGSASAKAIAAAKVGGKKSDTVIIATQNGFQDALSIAPYSYVSKSPILYAETSKKLSSATTSYIKSAKYRKAIIVGGPIALPASIETQLKKAGVTSVTRLAGTNAYRTSSIIANWTTGQLKNGGYEKYKGKNITSVKFQPAAANRLQANKLAVSTGQNWLDALAGAALCGKNKSVLLLADAKTAKSDYKLAPAWCKKSLSNAKFTNAYVFGGTSAVQAKVWNALVASTKVTTTVPAKVAG